MTYLPTLTISIDRTSLSLSPLVISGSAGTDLGLVGYSEPAEIPRVRSDSSDRFPGSTTLAWTLESSLLSFDVTTDVAASESASRASIAELRAAIRRVGFTITVTVDGATPEVWTAEAPGSLGPVDRTLLNLRDNNPVRTVSIPVYPIPA